MHLVCFLSFLSFALWAWGDVLTRAPVTYVLDYGGNHLGNERWLAETIAARPQLLHLGKDVVMTHNWGPIQALGGENQAYGKGEHIRRLSMAETRERMRALQEMIRRLHEGGVTWIMPYICAMTIGGHPERRTGFWEFYDHWEEYAAEFKLGPRPEEDPVTWLQIEPDGQPHFFYSLTEGKYPPYEPNIRYACCMNNPHWRYWSEQVVRLCAEVGYDGVFVDNAGSQRCFCRYCQDAFAEWLKQKYKNNLEKVYPQPLPGLTNNPRDGRAAVDSRLFWADTVKRHLLALKAAGEKIRRPFFVFPNGGEGCPEHVWEAYPPVDFLLFERSFGTFGTHPGRTRRRIVANIWLSHINDNIFENKLTQCVGDNVRPIMLTRDGYPITNPDWDLNPDAAALGMAESAAFSNGGGFCVRPNYEIFGDVLRQYRAFFERNASLYEGNESYAQILLACFPLQRLYNHPRHINSVRELTKALADCHLLFDYGPRTTEWNMSQIQRYALVILADVKYMSVSVAQQWLQYIRAGGKALIVGENATCSPDTLLPQESPFKTLQQDGQAHALGRGQYVCRALSPNCQQLWEILGQLGLQKLALMPPDANRHVRFNAFRKREGKSLYVHVLNYEVPLGISARVETAQEGLHIRLPLPPGAQIRQAIMHDPEQTQSYPVFAAPDGALTLPPLRIYQLLELRLE